MKEQKKEYTEEHETNNQINIHIKNNNEINKNNESKQSPKIETEKNGNIEENLLNVYIEEIKKN